VVKRYQFTPDHVTLRKDVPAVLVFRSEDVEHGIAIKELDVKADIHKGGETEVPVTPHAVGTFIGKCAHFCGTGHGRMQLTVDVSE
jgi:cytochrome c oxidase subunit 2